MKGKGVNPFELTPCWTLGGADRIRTGELRVISPQENSPVSKSFSLVQ
jgi:hypothetical protein